jgi:glutamine cyclotransferase
MALPSQSVTRATAPYVCPWVEVAQSTPVYTYQVVNSYHHDPAAYTQGLIYRDGILFEGTGLYGVSSLRRVELETGEVQQIVKLAHPYFGEGITELEGVIYQLTWTNELGFIYDVATFERLNTFTYSTEGWGLTHDGKNLIMSDGTPNLYFLDPETLQPISQVPVIAENIPVPRLNELEYINGEVWANVYQTSCIARIDPSNGQVVGWIDISGILTPEDLSGTQGSDGIIYHPEVPNGIAYDAFGKRIFITGKFWPKMYEIVVKGKK